MTTPPAETQPSLAGRLRSIPLALRMSIYGPLFLAGVLAGLPWLAYRADVYVPSLHVEVGLLRWVGVTIFTAFFVLYVYCSYLLSRIGRGAYVEFDPPAALVTVGPFRWSRNPIAACVVGMLLGEAIALSSTGIAMLFVIAVPLAHAQVVLLEEPLLRQRFGAAYDEYVARVPRWWPRRPRETTR